MTSPMLEKLAGLWPEIILLTGACACLVTGLSRSPLARRATVLTAAAALALSGLVALGALFEQSGRGLAGFIQLIVPAIGLLLLLLVMGAERARAETAEPAEAFDPRRSVSGEIHAFFLFSLVGVMLTAGVTDLVWLFLALELTSLPTYVLVATARRQPRTHEAAVKYFFLGALATAVFLYGFSLMYGATGFTDFEGIRRTVVEAGAAGPVLTTGLILALLGLAFKIAAVPMHFYAADVYEGADLAITAVLAFVPKAAGILAMAILLSTVGWALIPEAVTATLWILAALTMTVGNVMALLQENLKRMLAYSSVAHSGYLLVGLLAGPAALEGQTLGDGVAAVLFYLPVYGLATLAAFAVVGSLRRPGGEEAENLGELAGLARRHPLLAAVMLASMLSLIGLPPMAGFIGKIYLFGAAIEAGYVGLVVIAVLNSAISAVYYLRVVSTCYFGAPEPDAPPVAAPPARLLAATCAAAFALLLGLAGGPLVRAAREATGPGPLPPAPTASAETATATATAHGP